MELKKSKEELEQEYRDLLHKLRIHPKSLEIISSTFENRDGLKIHFRGWISETGNWKNRTAQILDGYSDSIKIIVFCHGMVSHSRPYILLADEFFNQNGSGDFLFFAIDYRGHGLSEGQRGYFKSLDLLINDVEDLILYLSKKYPKADFSLWGESMGGLIALTYLVEKYSADSPYKIKSSILWSPAIKPYPKVRIKDVFRGIYWLFVYLFKKDACIIPAENGNTFKNQEFDWLDVIDPLKINPLSPGYLLAINSAMNRVQSKKYWEKINVPICFLVGTKDIVVSMKETKKFYKKLVANNPNSPHKLIEIEGAWHNLYYDEDMKAEHWNEIIAWLTKNG